MTEYIVSIDDLKAIVEGRDIKHELKNLVRCKDCFFHGEFDENGFCVCLISGAGMPMYGFCSDGDKNGWVRETDIRRHKETAKD